MTTFLRTVVIVGILCAVAAPWLPAISEALIGFAPVARELPALPVLATSGPGVIHLNETAPERFFSAPGPESLVVASHGADNRVIYTGLADGRISRFSPKTLTWTTVARTCDAVGPRGCELSIGACGASPWDAAGTEPACGRPLGMRWLEARDALVVADAYVGLILASGISRATALKPARLELLSANFTLLNDVVVVISPPKTTMIYATDTSARYQRRRIFRAALELRATGRLVAYDLDAGKLEVLADGIFAPNGIEQLDDRTLLVVCGVQALKFDLVERRFLDDAFVAALPGTGDNVRRMAVLPTGERRDCFWFGLGSKYAEPFALLKAVDAYPAVRALLALLLPYKAFVEIMPKMGLLAVYDAQDGHLVATYQDRGGKTVGPWFSEVELLDGYLYFGSWYNPYLVRVPQADLMRRV
mmetsp:Transcript_21390/g.85067  ORF Transcript_21390/g.85067 Transcript_21390/m.85067 type:complete len:418 (-) Transcript_21390:60-1313(-)